MSTDAQAAIFVTKRAVATVLPSKVLRALRPASAERRYSQRQREAHQRSDFGQVNLQDGLRQNPEAIRSALQNQKSATEIQVTVRS